MRYLLSQKRIEIRDGKEYIVYKYINSYFVPIFVSIVTLWILSIIIAIFFDSSWIIGLIGFVLIIFSLFLMETIDPGIPLSERLINGKIPLFSIEGINEQLKVTNLKNPPEIWIAKTVVDRVSKSKMRKIIYIVLIITTIIVFSKYLQNFYTELFL